MADTIQRVEYFNAQVPNKYGLAGLVLDRATKRILSDAGSSARYRGAAQYSPSVPVGEQITPFSGLETSYA